MVNATLNKIKWGFMVLIIVATAISFFPSLQNDWTNWDDEVYVIDNELIRELNSENLHHWMKAYHHGNYHPFTMISYMFDYAFSDKKPNGEVKATVFHRHNYLLHLLNTALVFFLLLKLTKRIEIATIVGLIFGIHPLHVESVAWISERKDVLYTAFYIGALISYLYYLDNKKLSYYLATLVLVCCSLMSKSAAAVFPLSVILIDFLKHRNWDRQAIIDKIPFFALSIIFGILAIKSQNATESIAGFETFTLYQRFMFASFGAIIYPLKFLIPNELTCYHPYPHLVDNGTRLPYIWYAFPAIFALVLCLILWTIKKARWVIFGFGFYLVNVVLVLQFVSVGSAIYAERYSYVAYIGLAFLVAKGLVWLADNYKNYATITYSIFGALAIVLCFITYNQNKTWKNPETLWDKFTEVYPKDPYGMVKIAEYYMRFDDHEKTLGQFKKTVDKFPGHARSYAGMGNMYGKMGKYQEAINSFNLAEKVAQQTKTGVAELYPNRAITYSIMKQYEKAFPDYEKAIKADPKNYRIRVNRAFAFLDNGNYPEAIEEYSFVLQFEPNNPNHYFFRGIAYQNTQQFEKALSDYSTNINLNPKNPNTYHNRGICYEQLKQYKLALQDILTAQKLGKPENQLYINKLTQLANS